MYEPTDYTVDQARKRFWDMLFLFLMEKVLEDAGYVTSEPIPLNTKRKKKKKAA